MAEGRWVNIPGKGRRWQQPSGELMMTKPGFGQGEFFQTRASQLLGGIGNLLRPLAGPASTGVDFEQYASPAGRATSQNALLGRVPAPGSDSGWWRQSTASSGAASSSTGTSSSPAERAYQQEVSRVAQMAAQNPELQRYEAARQAAKTQEEMNAVRDEGMRIWAAKHGGLAAKVKPGSTGYEAIQGVVGSSAPSALSNEQVLGVMSFDPNTVLTTTQNIQGQFRPNQQLTDQEILNAMSFDPNTALRSAANIGYAPMSPTEAAMLKAVGGEQGEYITPMNAIGAPGQEGLSFVTPAEQRRRDSSALFQSLLNRANAQTR